MATGPTSSAPRQRDVRGVVIGVRELEKLRLRVKDLESKLGGSLDLVKAIGAQQRDAAKRRILQTKKAPDGKSWAPWSERYAKTRKKQHSLLVGERHLETSMTFEPVSPGEVIVGSPLVYARALLLGYPQRKLPARPYLDTGSGFADSRDRDELRDIVRAFMKKGLGI
jgi:hypothetical protein